VVEALPLGPIAPAVLSQLVNGLCTVLGDQRVKLLEATLDALRAILEQGEPTVKLLCADALLKSLFGASRTVKILKLDGMHAQAVELLSDIALQGPRPVAKVAIEMALHPHPYTRVDAANVLACLVSSGGTCTGALLIGCAKLLGAKEPEVKYAADSLLASLRSVELSSGMAAKVTSMYNQLSVTRKNSVDEFTQELAGSGRD